jgi:polyhydroxyalkanoate synthesis regulator phasin
MPQPKKPGSSARKPAARKPPARKTPARKPAASANARKTSSSGSAAKKPPPRAKPSAAREAREAQAREASRREDQLLAAIASLREVLTKGVVITGDRLQETVDEAVQRGRMTAQDAEELVQNLVAIGRRQSQDALAEIEGLVGRSAKETRRQARARVKSVGSAARRAPGTDRALRTVDRVRRAAGLGQSFPIIGYDDLTTAQVKQRLGDLNPAELRKVRDHERRNANRTSVLTAIERKLQ